MDKELFDKLFTRIDRDKFILYRFLNIAFGCYYSMGEPYWVEMKSTSIVTVELVFENLSQRDKLTFMFSLDTLNNIKSHPHAFKTKEEFDCYFIGSENWRINE